MPLIESRRARIAGMEFHYRLAGEGPGLLLLHAGICDSRMWSAELAAFSGSYRVAAPDLRGFGESPAYPGPYARRRDILAFLDHLGWERAHILGVSMSGGAAIDFALENPARISSLILVGSALSGFPYDDPVMGAVDQAIERAIEAGRLEEAADLNLKAWVAGPRRPLDAVAPEIRDLVRAMILKGYKKPADWRSEEPLEPPAIGRLQAIAAPTLVMLGDEDVLDIRMIADRLASEIPKARKIIIPGTAHLPNLEQPEIFARHVRDFLKGL